MSSAMIGSSTADLRRLKQDSEDISKALDDFLVERTAASRRQQEALDAYEVEVAGIGEIEEDHTEDMGVSVDHNVMRVGNIVKDSGEKYEFDDFDEYAGDFEFGGGETKEELAAQVRRLQTDNMRRKPIEADLAPKKGVPGFEDKVRIREEIFGFLDGCRLEEFQLLSEYERLQAASGEGSLPAERAAEVLLATQRQNHEQLVDMFEEYVPVAFGRAWGNDPDYASLSASLKKMVAGDAHFDVNEIIGSKKKGSGRKKGSRTGSGSRRSAGNASHSTSGFRSGLGSTIIEEGDEDVDDYY